MASFEIKAGSHLDVYKRQQYKFKMKKQQMMTKPDDMLPEDIDTIVEFEEE